MGIPYLTESEVNIGEQGIIFASGPVNPGRQVDRLTGEQVRNTHNSLHSYI